MSKFWKMYYESDGCLRLAGVFDSLEEANDLPLDESADILEVSGDKPVRAWTRHAGRYECIGNDSKEVEEAIRKYAVAYPHADGKSGGTFMYQPRPVYSDKVVEQPRLEEVPTTDVLGELAVDEEVEAKPVGCSCAGECGNE